MHTIIVGRAGEGQVSPDLCRKMFRLRHEVFHERLRWNVRSVGGLERDEFDDESTTYVIVKSLQSGDVIGSWRLRPTTLPYMLNDVFPELLHGLPAPHDPKIWEVSRFAVTNSGGSGSGQGFSDVTQDLVAQTVRFGQQNKLDSFVWVCSTAVERLAIRLGYMPTRLGSPLRIGTVQSVASQIKINRHTCSIAARRLATNALPVAA